MWGSMVIRRVFGGKKTKINKKFTTIYNIVETFKKKLRKMYRCDVRIYGFKNPFRPLS